MLAVLLFNWLKKRCKINVYLHHNDDVKEVITKLKFGLLGFPILSSAIKTPGSLSILQHKHRDLIQEKQKTLNNIVKRPKDHI